MPVRGSEVVPAAWTLGGIFFVRFSGTVLEFWLPYCCTRQFQDITFRYSSWSLIVTGLKDQFRIVHFCPYHCDAFVFVTPAKMSRFWREFQNAPRGVCPERKEKWEKYSISWLGLIKRVEKRSKYGQIISHAGTSTELKVYKVRLKAKSNILLPKLGVIYVNN